MAASCTRGFIASGHLVSAIHSRDGRVTALRSVYIRADCFRVDIKQQR
jgi:hypothetical protein